MEKKKSLKSMLKYHITTYFLLTLNYFCIYTWDYSLCLDLKCTSGRIFKNPSKYQFFPHKYNCSCAFCGFRFHLFDFISNYSTLKPGVSVDAKIIYSSLKNKLFVPIQYVQFENNENNKPYTYVINNKGLLEKRVLKLGKSDTLNYEVLSGLHEHEKLLNNSNHLYKEGEKIND